MLFLLFTIGAHLAGLTAGVIALWRLRQWYCHRRALVVALFVGIGAQVAYTSWSLIVLLSRGMDGWGQWISHWLEVEQ